MRLLPYYIIHTVINSIKKLFKTWVAFFIAICLLFGVIGGIVGVVVGSVVEESEPEQSYEEVIEEDGEIPEMTAEEIKEMQNVITGSIVLLTFAVVLFSIYGGDKSGTKIFTMPDVNFLFAAPIKPQSILMFRMVLQMGIAIASSLYVLFQIPNLVFNVGLNIYTCLCIFLGYGILLYLSRLAAVFTYTVTATHERLKKYIRPFVISVFALIGVLYYSFVKCSDMGCFEAVIYICSFKYIEYIPLFGWLSGLIMSTVRGSITEFIIYLVLIILALIGLTALIWKIKADFYEDAFSGANEIQETLNAAQNGETVQRKKERSQKISRNGVFKGEGAAIFYTKTIYNRHRFAKFGAFSNTAITYTLIAFVICLVLTVLLDFKSVVPIGFILTVCIFFRNLGNPLADEMSKSYIFTVPESPFKKLFYSILGSSFETASDLLLPFVISAVFIPKEITTLIFWYLLWISFDAFCSCVGLFTELAIPCAVVPSIKALLALFIRMIALVPGLIMLIIASAGNHPIFIVLTVFLNLIISVILLAVSQLFLHAGKK